MQNVIIRLHRCAGRSWSAMVTKAHSVAASTLKVLMSNLHKIRLGKKKLTKIR